MFQYVAEVEKVIDGDTIKAVVDLGFGIFKHTHLRFFGFDASEMHSQDPEQKARAVACKEYLKTLIEGKVIEIQTFKDKPDKYGRYLCRLWIEQVGGDMLDVIEDLKQKGFSK